MNSWKEMAIQQNAKAAAITHNMGGLLEIIDVPNQGAKSLSTAIVLNKKRAQTQVFALTAQIFDRADVPFDDNHQVNLGLFSAYVKTMLDAAFIFNDLVAAGGIKGTESYLNGDSMARMVDNMLNKVYVLGDHFFDNSTIRPAMIATATADVLSETYGFSQATRSKIAGLIDPLVNHKPQSRPDDTSRPQP